MNWWQLILLAAAGWAVIMVFYMVTAKEYAKDKNQFMIGISKDEIERQANILFATAIAYIVANVAAVHFEHEGLTWVLFLSTVVLCVPSIIQLVKSLTEITDRFAVLFSISCFVKIAVLLFMGINIYLVCIK